MPNTTLNDEQLDARLKLLERRRGDKNSELHLLENIDARLRLLDPDHPVRYSACSTRSLRQELDASPSRLEARLALLRRPASCPSTGRGEIENPGWTVNLVEVNAQGKEDQELDARLELLRPCAQSVIRPATVREGNIDRVSKLGGHGWDARLKLLKPQRVQSCPTIIPQRTVDGLDAKLARMKVLSCEDPTGPECQAKRRVEAKTDVTLRELKATGIPCPTVSHEACTTCNLELPSDEIASKRACSHS